MHIMVDLETVSLAPNAAILSIGACVFSIKGIHAQFYRKIDVNTCYDVGLVQDAGTIKWWSKQDEETRKEAFSGIDDITDVLLDFTEWYKVVDGSTLWGNGVLADNVWLTNAYKACDLIKPWSYKDDRCYRTTIALLPDVEWIQPTEAHNALADAIAQTRTLIKAWRAGGRIKL